MKKMHSFIKHLIAILLGTALVGMSVYAVQIPTSLNNALQYIMETIWTSDGTASGTTNVRVWTGGIYIATGFLQNGNAWNNMSLGLDTSGNVVYVPGSSSTPIFSLASNFIPKLDSLGSSLEISVMYQSGGLIGVNKTNPTRSVNVLGDFLVETQGLNVTYQYNFLNSNTGLGYPAVDINTSPRCSCDLNATTADCSLPSFASITDQGFYCVDLTVLNNGNDYDHNVYTRQTIGIPSPVLSTSGANVGVRTDTPQAALDVSGNVMIHTTPAGLNSWDVLTINPTTKEVSTRSAGSFLGGSATGYALNNVGGGTPLITTLSSPGNIVWSAKSLIAGPGISLSSTLTEITISALGGSSNGWNLTGNAGTNPATNFIGTTDSQDLVVRTNNVESLRVTDSGAIVSRIGGNLQASSDIPVRAVGTRFMWVPHFTEFMGSNTGRALRIGNLETNEADRWDPQNMGVRSTAIGQSVRAKGSYSIALGARNSVYTAYSNILGGGNNTITGGSYSTIAGGAANTIHGVQSVIGGGGANTATGNTHTIGGGQYNAITGARSNTIGGGEYNTINSSAQDSATIAGGKTNTVSAGYATIGGGWNNIASGLTSFIGGGYQNTASGQNSVVAGGENNRAFDQYTFIGGGINNYINGAWTTIAGGYANTGNGDTSFIGGGNNNNIVAGQGNTIAGGAYNAIYNSPGPMNNFIGGGAGNAITSNGHGVIAGGSNNTITNNAMFGSILGGSSNNVSEDGASIIGGANNIAAGVHSFAMGEGNLSQGAFAAVPGGQDNQALGTWSFAAGQNAIASGDNSFVWSDGDLTQNSNIYNNEFRVSSDRILLGRHTPMLDWAIQAYTGANFDIGLLGTTVADTLRVDNSLIQNLTVTNSYFGPSDSRLKTNINSGTSRGTSALNILTNLNPVTYQWADNPITAGFGFDYGKLHYGFIAQEVETVVPELVMENDQLTSLARGLEGGGIKSLNTLEMIPILVQAVKEQQAIIEDLQARVLDLETP